MCLGNRSLSQLGVPRLSNCSTLAEPRMRRKHLSSAIKIFFVCCACFCRTAGAAVAAVLRRGMPLFLFNQLHGSRMLVNSILCSLSPPPWSGGLEQEVNRQRKQRTRPKRFNQSLLCVVVRLHCATRTVSTKKETNFLIGGGEFSC